MMTSPPVLLQQLAEQRLSGQTGYAEEVAGRIHRQGFAEGPWRCDLQRLRWFFCFLLPAPVQFYTLADGALVGGAEKLVSGDQLAVNCVKIMAALVAFAVSATPFGTQGDKNAATVAHDLEALAGCAVNNHVVGSAYCGIRWLWCQRINGLMNSRSLMMQATFHRPLAFLPLKSSVCTRSSAAWLIHV